MLLRYVLILFHPYSFIFYGSAAHRDLHSFPTRRSSDLAWANTGNRMAAKIAIIAITTSSSISVKPLFELLVDRKSTRLNSSHLGISYAVFCLKKKKQHNHQRAQHHGTR